jgi:hypothetical protein
MIILLTLLKLHLLLHGLKLLRTIFNVSIIELELIVVKLLHVVQFVNA